MRKLNRVNDKIAKTFSFNRSKSSSFSIVIPFHSVLLNKYTVSTGKKYKYRKEEEWQLVTEKENKTNKKKL